MQNSLFNYLNSLVSENIDLPNCQVVFAQDKEKTDYYRLELADSEFKCSVGNAKCTLENHHISIYKTEYTNNPSLSQYHYTAYLKDKKKRTYQLHVYFNSQEELTKMPVISIADKNGVFTPIDYDNKELESRFIEQAINQSKPIIEILRSQLQDRINILEHDYNNLDISAVELSKDIEENWQKYFEILEQMECVLSELTQLAPQEHYRKKQALVHNLKIAIKNQFMHRETVITEVVDFVATEEKSPLESPVVFFKPTKKDTVQTISNNMNQKIEAFKKQYTTLTDEIDIVAQAKQLGELHSKIYELLIDFVDESTTVSNYFALQNLLQQIRAKAENLCMQLLFDENNIESVTSLPDYQSLLNSKYFKVALTTRNHKALDFILTHSDCNLINQPVVINNNTYLSPADFCMKTHSTKDSMEKCLEVLIKHGESVLVKGNDNLPLAYHLLSTGNSLQNALKANRDKTIDSVVFYKKLILELKQYQLNSNSELIPKIKKAIANYEQTIKNLMPKLANSIEKRNLKVLSDFTETFAETIGQDALSEILADIVITTRVEKYKQLCAEYIKMLDPIQRRQLTKRNTDIMVNLNSIFQKDDFGDVDLIKEQACSFLDNRILHCEKSIELLSLKKKVYNQSGLSKQQKHLKLQNKLIKEIVELDKVVNIDKNFDNVEKNFENSLDDIQNSTAGMKDFFAILRKEMDRVVFKKEGDKFYIEIMGDEESDDEEEISHFSLTK